MSAVFKVMLQLLPTALAAFLFAAVGIVHVTSRVMVVDVGYKLSALEQTNVGLVRENNRLKLELATQKNPARLERLARDALGMGPPAPGTVLSLRGAKPPVHVQVAQRLEAVNP